MQGDRGKREAILWVCGVGGAAPVFPNKLIICAGPAVREIEHCCCTGVTPSWKAATEGAKMATSNEKRPMLIQI